MASSRAAEDIARQTAREVLGPLLDTACARLAFVLRRVFEIAADRAIASGKSRIASLKYLPSSTTFAPGISLMYGSTCRQQQGHPEAIRGLPCSTQGSTPSICQQA